MFLFYYYLNRDENVKTNEWCDQRRKNEKIIYKGYYRSGANNKPNKGEQNEMGETCLKEGRHRNSKRIVKGIYVVWVGLCGMWEIKFCGS